MNMVLGFLAGFLIGLAIMIRTVDRLNKEVICYQDLVLEYQDRVIDLLKDKVRLMITVGKMENEE